jgi:hypothetical protein
MMIQHGIHGTFAAKVNSEMGMKSPSDLGSVLDDGFITDLDDQLFDIKR